MHVRNTFKLKKCECIDISPRHIGTLSGPLLPILSTATSVTQNSTPVGSVTVVLVLVVVILVLPMSSEELMIVTTYCTAQLL